MIYDEMWFFVFVDIVDSHCFNKNVDIQFSAHDVFLEQPSSGTPKV